MTAVTTTSRENAMTDTTSVTDEPAQVLDDETESVVEQDLLVEDVSIDGMCGVY